MFLSGCASQAPTPSPVTPAPQAQTPAPATTMTSIYPDLMVKAGEKYGEMTVAQTPDAAARFVAFQGNVTVTGSYTYYPKDEAFGSDERACLIVTVPAELVKLPRSQYFSAEADKMFCFTNVAMAKQLLGTSKSPATVTISDLNDNANFAGESNSTATLVSASPKK